MSKPTLWIMCGLSGSGKSTIATQIANENPNTVIVSSDAIREELTGNYEDQQHNEEVFKIFHDRIRKNLENKKNVIADATNLTMKSRRAIMMKVNGLNVRKVCVIIPKLFEQCKKIIYIENILYLTLCWISRLENSRFRSMRKISMPLKFMIYIKNINYLCQK